MIYVLTHEYSDKSGFHVCGVTEHEYVANAWWNAADDNRVYRMDLNVFCTAYTGWPAWEPGK